MSGPGLYVYAITDGAPGELGTGLDGAPVRLVTPAGGPSAVVHEHDGGPYEGPDDDVRRWVVEHSDVVDRVWQGGSTVLPVSFNVIVAAAEDAPAQRRLEDWLGTHQDRIRARLAALAGRVELRVEVGLDQRQVGEGHPDLEAARREMADRTPGVQRLLRKRLEQREREVADALADELYQDYRRRLARLSEDLSENRGARPEPGTVPVLSVSLLVPADDVSAVGRELAAIQDEQSAARIRYLGPWPPYSFAELPGVAGPAAS
ncbi:GvpL/GvpF family gas vesicle protein [Georgenia alba]|uniref:GvpL/GvpF family gas vesicle protein n=1 Tax=Georgenia alba TaxID=2233858 RepID=A0ABW2Q799_9MICO